VGKQVSKWAPTEEDLKDCGHCRGGWPLVIHNGYRAHRSSPDAEITPCFSTGPLRLAPPAPKRDYSKLVRFVAKKFGYFLIGDALLGIVVLIALAILKGVHFILVLLPGGVDQAIEYARRGAIGTAVGLAAIYGLTTAGEYIWKTFTKPASKEESST
jgi:hypothetical protein